MAFSHIYMWERGVIHLELQCEGYKIHLGGQNSKTHIFNSNLYLKISKVNTEKNTSVRLLH